MLDHLSTVGDVSEYIVGHEKHADGNSHLHCYIKFALEQTPGVHMDRFDIKRPDEGKNYHPNIKFIDKGGVKKVAAYCIKHGHYDTNVDVDGWLKKKGKHVLTLDEITSVPLRDLIRDGKITAYSAPNVYRTRMLIQQQDREAKYKSMNVVLPKKRHFWHWGPANTGKTTHRQRMQQTDWKDDNFEAPINNDWAYYNGEQYIWIEEYNGRLLISELNRICDGGCQVNTKGGSNFIPSSVVFHVFSNFNIEDCYPNNTLIHTLKARFTEIEYKKLN